MQTLEQIKFDQSYFVKATKFDWFCAGVEVDVVLFVQSAQQHFDADVEHCLPRNGYRYAVKLYKGALVHCIVMWGGENVGSALYVLATGYESNSLRDWLVITYPSSYLIRADICIDIDEPGCFVDLYKLALGHSREFRLKTANAGDWSNALGGRTFYCGSRQSPAFMRLYEKGKQLIKGSPDHVRLEFEFKPKNMSARLAWFSAPAAEYWTFNKWVGNFFEKLSGLPIDPSSIKVGTYHRQSDHDRAMHHLVKQYRNTIKKELTNNGGDYLLLLSRLVGNDFYPE